MPSNTEYAELIERLRLSAQKSSEIQRSMAEAKSLRQDSNAERRTDLYMWPTPEQTLEGKAATALERLSSDREMMRSALNVARRRFVSLSATAVLNRQPSLETKYDQFVDEIDATLSRINTALGDKE